MSTVFCRFFCYSCIQNGKGIRYLGKQGGAAGLGLLLGILQNGDGIARSIRRVKTGKPVMQQLPAVCIKLAGLSRAGFTGGGTGMGLGIAANAAADNGCQHTLQHPCNRRAAGRCGLRLLRNLRPAGDAADNTGAVIYPAGGYGIEHGRYLQWGNGQPALPEGKACQTACILQVCRAGQLPRRALQPRRQQGRGAKAKALRGIQNCLPAQQLAQRNKVTVTALFQRAAQVDGAVRPPQRTAEGFPAVWMLPVQS